ncbi:TPA: hypothetical protein ACPYV0_003037 [Citrobacter amalonaticus]
MTKVLVYGGGHNGVVRDVDLSEGLIRIARGDWVSDRNTFHEDGKVESVNYDEEFIIRKFNSSNGKEYFIAEHGITISDVEIQKRIDVLISLQSLS